LPAFWFALAIAGCTRPYFRHKADAEVAEVLAGKDKYPQWCIEQYHVYPDPRARFADPTCPDHPPMPPDDPAAWALSPHPQRPYKDGIARVEGNGYVDLLAAWDAENRAAPKDDESDSKTDQADKDKKDQPAGPMPAARGQSAADPKADAAAPPGAAPPPAPGAKPEGANKAQDGVGAATSNPDTKPPTCGCFLINLEQSVELGLINSREYQDRREDLYLTAMPVTQERFAFAAQPWLTEQAFRERTGRDTPEGEHNRFRFETNTGFAKLFSTGALLLFNIANETLIEFARAPRRIVSTSTLSLDLIQPLLRGGGRAVTLEPLTQVERNLLYQIRTFARFRKEFFVSIAGGGSISGGGFVPTGVITNAAFSPSQGIGASPLIPGVIPSVTGDVNRLAVNPGTSGRLNLNTAIQAPVAGYLGSLLQHAQIAIDEGNIAKLQEFLKLFEAFKEGGDISQLQVDQVEQQLLSGRTTLLTDQQQYGNIIDQFKLQLGLPTDICLELDDKWLRGQKRQFKRYEEIFAQYEAAGKEALSHGDPAFTPKLRAELRRLFTSSAIARGTRFVEGFPARWASWERLSAEGLAQRLRRLMAEQSRLRDRKSERDAAGQKLDEADRKRLAELDDELALGSFEESLRDYETQPWRRLDNPERRQLVQTQLFRAVIGLFVSVLGEARNERIAGLRNSWPELPRLCVEGKDLLKGDEGEAMALATRTALTNRLDLMNARALVVDAWRQIAIFANALLGTINVEYHLDSFTPFGQAKPLAFGGTRNRNQLIVNAEPPLIRKNERNNYRASLIAYQRRRRELMEAEDLVLQGVRGEIRQLRVLAQNYKIQQRQVELAYLTVENSLDVFSAPPGATGVVAGGASSAVQAATLTNQLLGAQGRLPAAQNQLLTVWTSYLQTRFQLYRDIELMPLDFRGVWIDDPTACDDAVCPAGTNSQPGDQRGNPGSEGSEGGAPDTLPRPRLLPPAVEGPELE
jgi:hypothetical protein